MNAKQRRVLSLLAILVGGVLVTSLIFINYYSIDKKRMASVEKVDKEKAVEARKNLLEDAQKLAKSYNYEQAIELLEQESSKESKQVLKEIKSEKDHLVTWNDPFKISHIFFHSLIVDAKKAFSSKQAQGYRDYMVTISEFNKIIDQLYKNNYVLVDLNKLVKKNPEGKLSFSSVSLPKGKKPLILSQDDVSYYEYMDDSGFPSKLVVEKQGTIKNIYKENRKETIGDYDVVPLIDSFIKKHPDFSYQGAKGTLALTGYDGVLGYRTSKSKYGDNKNTNNEIEKAQKVAKQLKKNGWSFASHTWGHINMTQSSLPNIQKDNELWQKEVAPILGTTPILIYPFGADISDGTPYDENNMKFKYLENQGFRIFCNVDASIHSWGQLGENYYRNARINIDGLRFQSTIEKKNATLDQFFSVEDIYDKQARN